MNWDEAYAWEKAANIDREDWREPVWRWDCNFKLDFDGPIVRISSRYYRETAWADGGRGRMTLIIGDEEIVEKEIEGASLDDLKAKVLVQTKEWTDRIEKAICAEFQE